MVGYLVQQGVDGACVYWNAQAQCSSILSPDPIKEVGDFPFTLEEAIKVRDRFDQRGNYRSTFKVVKIEL